MASRAIQRATYNGGRPSVAPLWSSQGFPYTDPPTFIYRWAECLGRGFAIPTGGDFPERGGMGTATPALSFHMNGYRARRAVIQPWLTDSYPGGDHYTTPGSYLQDVIAAAGPYDGIIPDSVVLRHGTRFTPYHYGNVWKEWTTPVTVIGATLSGTYVQPIYDPYPDCPGEGVEVQLPLMLAGGSDIQQHLSGGIMEIEPAAGPDGWGSLTSDLGLNPGWSWDGTNWDDSFLSPPVVVPSALFGSDVSYIGPGWTYYATRDNLTGLVTVGSACPLFQYVAGNVGTNGTNTVLFPLIWPNGWRKFRVWIPPGFDDGNHSVFVAWHAAYPVVGGAWRTPSSDVVNVVPSGVGGPQRGGIYELPATLPYAGPSDWTTVGYQPVASGSGQAVDVTLTGVAAGTRGWLTANVVDSDGYSGSEILVYIEALPDPAAYNFRLPAYQGTFT